MGEVELVKFTTYMVIIDGGSVWKFWPYWSIFSWNQPYTYCVLVALQASGTVTGTYITAKHTLLHAPVPLVADKIFRCATVVEVRSYTSSY